MDGSQASAGVPSTPSGANAADKPRLTEEEKKINHIASEQKRRQAIREGFDQLASLTPGMEGQGRSEALVLQAFNAEMRRELARRWRGILRLRNAGRDAAQWEMDPETMRMAEEYASMEESEIEQ